MRLSESFSHQVPASIRERGRKYDRDGSVVIMKGDSSEVQAFVFGGSRYTVSLALSEDQLAVSCTCPYFEGSGGGICKHIWATLLAGEARGYLRDYHDVNEDMSQQQTPTRSNPSFWSTRLNAIAGAKDDGDRKQSPDRREILYIFNVNETRSSGGLKLDVVYRDLKRDGSWSKLKSQQIKAQLIRQLDDANDRQILSMILGSQEPWSGYGYYAANGLSGSRVPVPGSMTDVLVPLICQTGRAHTRSDFSDDQLMPLSWKDGSPWEICLAAKHDAKGRNLVITGRLQRGDEHMSLDRPQMLLAGGFVFGDDGVVERVEDFGAFGWVSSIRTLGPLVIPIAQSDEFLTKILSLPNLPKLDLPPALSYDEVQIVPRPCLQIQAGSRYHRGGTNRLVGSLSFDYQGEVVKADEAARGIFQSSDRRFLLRDRKVESEASETMKSLGFRFNQSQEYELAPRQLPNVVRSLTNAGWRVEAEGKLYKAAGAWKMNVASGIDWFELTGDVEFGGETASLPELMAALRRGENYVVLGDGTMGLLPEEWLERYRLLAGVGEVTGDALRFKRTQVGLLDALLASQPDVTLDEVFVRARDQIRAFKGVDDAKEPPGFVGELREYQREGLGWINFLQQFGFGGCLADDMGLGKTVQVLALLESRRQLKTPPSLVVVPASLVFNWTKEAERFTPKLKVLNHTGARLDPGEHFDEYDVILTTYGTLRRDALHFNAYRFDYCILDEAQAIKNPSTASAKAARLLKAEHRLALSGTPIENHLGELWSLFEFLNPGILGSASAFNGGLNNSNGADDSARTVLAQALRPFILRRTKDQVAKDLPTKTEQTMYCELGTTQRKHYDQLKNHFRRDLLKKVDTDGMQKSKILVLTALLRLRQAACHPGLIDESKVSESSAKLDVLIPQLVEVAEEGHKSLVFSQFTKMLAIVRDRLDREGVVYEYLDGRTRDRQARVERFQEDPDCRVFLISLKAGGLGLNLTAAEYVFLLDPWWNPAVEAQAIDRTHRIGQALPVFAYRIIARDTIEEKVLQLQESKRTLADSIITADNSLIKHMRREDLELLLT
ncbi:MAG: DEAD/DEAH box helicase [Actinomycetota bacterium]